MTDDIYTDDIDNDDWYYIKKHDLQILLDELTNDILNNVEPIPEKYNNLHWSIYLENDNLDFDKLMSKLIYCKYLIIYSEKIQSNIKLPPNLEYYNDKSNNNSNITIFPNTLKEYINVANNVKIPKNLPLSLSCVYVKLNETFYNIHANITELHISNNTIDMDNILWPINLKKLHILIHKKNKKSIGILPCGLEDFFLSCENYDYPLELPPSLTKFNFHTRKMYKYSISFNSLPNSVENICLRYTTCPNISILPKSCKNFTYLNCPKYFINTLKLIYPDITIT